MDPWNQGQRMMGVNHHAGVSQNPNHQQNFFRPANQQQFYPNQAGLPGHTGFQRGPHQPGPGQQGARYPRNMSQMPQHFIPSHQTQSHPSKQLSQAELEELRKKKHFEEQQRRLLAMKQKPGQPSKTQLGNPLNDLFGKKGSGSKNSLLGSLGEASKPKEYTPGFSGSVIPSHATFSSPNPGAQQSNWKSQETSMSSQSTSGQNNSFLGQSNYLSGQETGRLEHFQGFSQAKQQDDFGDFQHSPANQAFGNSTQNLLPKHSTTDNNPMPSNVPTSVGLMVSSNVPNNTSNNPSVSSNIPPGVGLTMSSRIPNNPASPSSVPNRSSQIMPPSSVPSTDYSPVPNSNLEVAHYSATNMGDKESTPSIEELMKKSLSLDNQSQASAKRFQKPTSKLHKSHKMVKSVPSHFTESSKASKWDNLESLSEVFTIPQPAVVQPEAAVSGGQNNQIDNSGDDWSDFSGVDQHGGVFQDHGIPPLPQGSSEFLTTKPETGPPLYGHAQFPGMSSANSGSTGMELVNSVPALSGGAPGLPVHGIPGVISTAHEHPPTENRVVPEPIEGSGPEQPVDPEQQIYGVQLPGWSKQTSLLPAVYKQVYKICSGGDGVISTSQLYPILLSSDLPRDKLGHIWSQCNKAVLGELNEQELYLILGMVALAQVGLQMNKLTLGKLASCTTPPIPSFPERIFQNDVESTPSIPAQQVATSTSNNVTASVDTSQTFHNEDGSVMTPHLNTLPKHIDAVKQPDWSKWKTSKAGHIDDKFKDFQTIMPKDRSSSFQEQDPSLLPDVGSVPSVPEPTSFKSFHDTATPGQVLNTGLGQTGNASNQMANLGSSSMPGVRTKQGDEFGAFQTKSGQPVDANNDNFFPEFQSSSRETFGDFTGGSSAETQNYYAENKTPQISSHVISVPLQAAQRYTLSGEDENIDHHEKAWLKCLTSCFAVITKSYQLLQTITDPQLIDEIFSSQQGISHFSAIIEIYCVSQRVKASVLKSAPNNMKLKEALQNIDNVWKTCLTFSSFKALLPSQSLNFSGCHVNENEDLNLTCGVCLLNVDKSWVSSLVNKGRSGKLNYGSRFYHTTCANFWCNKVDSVLPALQLNVGNSLI